MVKICRYGGRTPPEPTNSNLVTHLMPHGPQKFHGLQKQAVEGRLTDRLNVHLRPCPTEPVRWYRCQGQSQMWLPEEVGPFHLHLHHHPHLHCRSQHQISLCPRHHPVWTRQLIGHSPRYFKTWPQVDKPASNSYHFSGQLVSNFLTPLATCIYLHDASRTIARSVSCWQEFETFGFHEAMS